MVFYKFHNGKRYYYFNGVLKRFRERVDSNITKDELISVLKRIDFPILGIVEVKDGMKKVVGYYSVDLIEEYINSKKSLLLDKLREKREYDSGKYAMMFRKQKPPVYDNRTEEEIEAEYQEKRKKEMEKRKTEMLKRLEAEEEKERKSPEEDMDKVSDELLKKDDVYYTESLSETHDNTVREELTDFGKVWYIDSPDCSFRFAMYRYDDDLETVYVSNIFVDEEKRGNGLGNMILDTATSMSKELGAKTMCLKVKKDSFAHQWYMRHGYTDIETDSENENYEWMRKQL